MSRSISQQEWSLRRDSFEGRTEEVRLNQQRLFRVFQALAKQDHAMGVKYLADGAPIDLPLILDDQDPKAIPNAGNWRPVGGEHLQSVTLLGWAAGNGDIDNVKWLLRHGAEPSQTFSGNIDAAWLAMEQGNDDIHRILIERGAAPSLRRKDEFSTTRLMAAVMGAHVNAVRHILTRLLDVNAVNKRGQTALHLNFAKDPYTDEDADIARMLLDKNANPNMEDLDGVPPHALNDSHQVASLLAGHELSKVTPDVVQAKQRQQPEEPEAEPELEPGTIVVPMPRQGPRRL